jgi:hypothetical protein
MGIARPLELDVGAVQPASSRRNPKNLQMAPPAATFGARGIEVARRKRVASNQEYGAPSMAANQQPFDDVLRRVQGEYLEMPGLRLTTAQAQRLWGLDRIVCDTLLGALVDAKFLSRTRDGSFVRTDQGRAARSQKMTLPG